jgi:hypothetical protein
LLNEFRRDLERPARIHLDTFFANVLPLLGGWASRKRRRVPHDWSVALKLNIDGAERTLSGKVEDVCVSGRGYHVRLGPEVQCEAFRQGQVIHAHPNPLSHEVEMLVEGRRLFVRTAGFTLYDPKRRNVPIIDTDAWLLRGWKYEVGLNQVSDESGVVLWIQDPSLELVSRISSLPELVGGEGTAGKGDHEHESATEADAKVPAVEAKPTALVMLPQKPARRRSFTERVAARLSHVYRRASPLQGRQMETMIRLLRRHVDDAEFRRLHPSFPRRLDEFDDSQLDDYIGYLRITERSNHPSLFQTLEMPTPASPVQTEPWIFVEHDRDETYSKYRCAFCGKIIVTRWNERPSEECDCAI